MMKDVISLVSGLLVLCILILLAYLCRKYFGKNPRIGGSRYIHLLDRLPLGQDKQLLIVQIEGKNYLLSVQQNEIRLLTELPALSEPPEEEESTGKESFSAYLQEYLERIKKGRP